MKLIDLLNTIPDDHEISICRGYFDDDYLVGTGTSGYAINEFMRKYKLKRQKVLNARVLRVSAIDCLGRATDDEPIRVALLILIELDV